MAGTENIDNTGGSVIEGKEKKEQQEAKYKESLKFLKDKTICEHSAKKLDNLVKERCEYNEEFENALKTSVTESLKERYNESEEVIQCLKEADDYGEDYYEYMGDEASKQKLKELLLLTSAYFKLNHEEYTTKDGVCFLTENGVENMQVEDEEERVGKNEEKKEEDKEKGQAKEKQNRLTEKLKGMSVSEVFNHFGLSDYESRSSLAKELDNAGITVFDGRLNPLKEENDERRKNSKTRKNMGTNVKHYTGGLEQNIKLKQNLIKNHNLLENGKLVEGWQDKWETVEFAGDLKTTNNSQEQQKQTKKTETINVDKNKESIESIETNIQIYIDNIQETIDSEEQIKDRKNNEKFTQAVGNLCENVLGETIENKNNYSALEDYVALLQSKINLELDNDIYVDGKFGQKTLDAFVKVKGKLVSKEEVDVEEVDVEEEKKPTDTEKTGEDQETDEQNENIELPSTKERLSKTDAILWDLKETQELSNLVTEEELKAIQLAQKNDEKYQEAVSDMHALSNRSDSEKGDEKESIQSRKEAQKIAINYYKQALRISNTKFKDIIEEKEDENDDRKLELINEITQKIKNIIEGVTEDHTYTGGDNVEGVGFEDFESDESNTESLSGPGLQSKVDKLHEAKSPTQAKEQLKDIINDNKIVRIPTADDGRENILIYSNEEFEKYGEEYFEQEEGNVYTAKESIEESLKHDFEEGDHGISLQDVISFESRKGFDKTIFLADKDLQKTNIFGKAKVDDITQLNTLKNLLKNEMPEEISDFLAQDKNVLSENELFNKPRPIPEKSGYEDLPKGQRGIVYQNYMLESKGSDVIIDGGVIEIPNKEFIEGGLLQKDAHYKIENVNGEKENKYYFVKGSKLKKLLKDIKVKEARTDKKNEAFDEGLSNIDIQEVYTEKAERRLGFNEGRLSKEGMIVDKFEKDSNGINILFSTKNGGGFKYYDEKPNTLGHKPILEMENPGEVIDEQDNMEHALTLEKEEGGKLAKGKTGTEKFFTAAKLYFEQQELWNKAGKRGSRKIDESYEQQIKDKSQKIHKLEQ